jgi:hypothetical protein
MSDPNTTAHPCLWCKLLTNAGMTCFNIPTSKFVIHMCRKGRWCVLFIVVVYVTSWVLTQTQVLVMTSKHAITAANSVCLFLFLSWKCV